MKKVAIAIVIIAIIALVVCLVPLKEVAYTVTVDYQDTETYYVDEPYEDTETYYETVPLDYEVVKAFAQVEGTTPVVYVTLQNRDSVSGTFTVQLTLWESGITITKSSMEFWSRPYPYEELLDLQPNETKTIKYSADGIDIIRNDWDWIYGITPSTKTIEKERTITKHRQVEKQRTVTKHRQVEKERTVTKQRPETHYKKVTLPDYLLHY